MVEKGCCAPRKLTGTLGAKAENEARLSLKEKWVVGSTGIGDDRVPLVSTTLRGADVLGTWKSRWAMGRDDYSVHPGLYGVGSPGEQSPVLVTANYKMTLDSLRRELTGLDAWILVLDTHGINVWCAAGKGTFGTKELVRRIRAVELGRRVSHRSLILPQLGAVGVQAHEVKKETGFKVTYGPVRAADLPAFLAAGQVATPAMRKVRFNTLDRLALAPAELVFTFKPIAIALGVLFLLNVLGIGSYGATDLYALAGAVLVGCVLTPVLLPMIPGRAFSLKGAELGLLWAVAVCVLNGWPSAPAFEWPKALAYLLILPSVSAYLAMNFTGSTTYTSPSGVNREMRAAIPAMLIATALGLLLLLGGGLAQLFR